MKITTHQAAATMLACYVQLVSGFHPANMATRAPPAGQMLAAAGTPKNSTFMQWIDHDNHALGKFSQFYYWNDTFYKGPGSPVVIFTPGELNVDLYTSYLTTDRITGVLAQDLGAAVIVIEHRYWKYSSPYRKLTTENMQYLTLKNAIADWNNFALHAELPFDKTGATNADKAPWVMVGGSYSGGLTAWTEALSNPRTIWAYWSSSGLVQSVGNFWEYFLPQTIHMPQNCSTDISRVVEYLDDVYETGTLEKQAKMKKMFGLGDLTHYDDFMNAIVQGPYLWQSIQDYTTGGFFDFCDAVEGVTSKSKKVPGPSGVGVEKALANYAKWVKEQLIPDFCKETYGYYSGKYTVDCFDTHNYNSPLYRDTSLSNTYYRQYDWMLCNEPFGWWQNGAPKKQKTIMSRLIDNRFWVRQCAMWWPTENGVTYGLRKGATYNDVNAYTGGWTTRNSTRLLYINGDRDPWRESSVSATTRPGGPMQWTPDQPVYVIPGGYHGSDLVTENGRLNPDVRDVQMRGRATIKQWVEEFPGFKERIKNRV